MTLEEIGKLKESGEYDWNGDHSLGKVKCH